MAFKRLLKVCQKIFVLQIKLKSKLPFETQDLNLLLSSKRLEKVGRRQKFNASTINCRLSHKTNAQSVEFNHALRLNHIFHSIRILILLNSMTIQI